MVKVELNKRDLTNIQAKLNSLVNLSSNLKPALNEIDSSLPYAAIHQLDGQAGRGRKVTITARPFLGINIQDETEIGNILIKNIQRALA